MEFSAKRRKLENSALIPMIQGNGVKREAFSLNLSSKSHSSASNEDAVGFNYVISKHNPAQSENGSLQLPGNWEVGITKFLMTNEIISFKKVNKNSVGFLYIVVKPRGKKGIALPIIYYEHKLYDKVSGVEYANRKLRDVWLKICNPNEKGRNIVGEYFTSSLFNVFLSEVDDYIYIKSLGNKTPTSKNAWTLFQNLFQKFAKKSLENFELENVYIYASYELLNFWGGFTFPSIIESFDTGEDFNEVYDGVTLTKKISVIPYPDEENKTISMSIRAENLQALVQPLGLNILTNILGQEQTRVVNISDRTFARFQVICSIPLNQIDSTLPGITYIPSEVSYKKLPSDCRIDKIAIFISDTANEKLISLNTGETFLTLEFLPM